MSASPGSIESQTQEAIARFADALQQRIGADRYRLWFHHGVDMELRRPDPATDPSDRDGVAPTVMICTSGPFNADRIKKCFASELRASAIMALGDGASFEVVVRAEQHEHRGQAGEQQGESKGSNATPTSKSPDHARSRDPRSATPPGRQLKRHATKLSSILESSTVRGGRADQLAAETSSQSSPTTQSESRPASSNQVALAPLPDSQPTAGRTIDSFIVGPCNEFAFSAATMAITNPEVATPLFLHGPTGTGKSHLLAALAHEFRSRRRMRRVVLLTAEQFTNDFVVSVHSTGLPAFRRRYRDVDALLIDDVHFLAEKSATLREALYTVETLAAAGKPLVFSANLPPAEIRGLTGEVAGRMSSGLVCPLASLDAATRLEFLQRLVKTRCVLQCDPHFLQEVSEMVSGDARAITGIANMLGMLQRMYRREPTLDELKQFGGDLLRNTQASPTLRTIEKAVCEAFGLENDGLRGNGQTRRVSEPRTLAMYLARQHTGSAFTEIAKHFGRRSHSGAVAAQQKVEQWIATSKPIGGGESALQVQDAIARVEARLRIG